MADALVAGVLELIDACPRAKSLHMAGRVYIPAMHKWSGRVGLAVVAVLVVACGDAMLGTMMQDIGTVLMDAGNDVDNGVQAQGPGDWVVVPCEAARVVRISQTGYMNTTTTYQARFAANVDALVEVEVCLPASTTDANNDGCPDTPPSGQSCTSTENTPLTCARTHSTTRVATSPSRVHVDCGYEQTVGTDTYGSRATSIRYRIR
ncbi:MAG: hypothetical protein H6716_29200 [Polyangiaceae bacterium]|nr:hypothetical protein [Polyangiaceae bacterium]